jgi:hypothetical protein
MPRKYKTSILKEAVKISSAPILNLKLFTTTVGLIALYCLVVKLHNLECSHYYFLDPWMYIASSVHTTFVSSIKCLNMFLGF